MNEILFRLLRVGILKHYAFYILFSDVTRCCSVVTSRMSSQSSGGRQEFWLSLWRAGLRRARFSAPKGPRGLALIGTHSITSHYTYITSHYTYISWAGHCNICLSTQLTLDFLKEILLHFVFYLRKYVDHFPFTLFNYFKTGFYCYLYSCKHFHNQHICLHRTCRIGMFTDVQ